MIENCSVETVLRALGDPTRRVVFERIVASGEATVSELTRRSGVSQGAISQHLKVLKSAGLVADRSEGRNVHYRVQPGGLSPLTDWLDHYADFWRDRFKDLRTLLKDMDQ